MGLSAALGAGESVEHLIPGSAARSRVAGKVGDQAAEEGCPGRPGRVRIGPPKLSVGRGRFNKPVRLLK